MKKIKHVTPRLSAILKKRGITHATFAEKVGLLQPTISRFDKMTRHESINLFRIAQALDLRIEDLFEVEYDKD
ncbi:helix-turn-helix domain-containing protein [Desmospora activa]|uniref:DNA-binding XRE family transcriptional regulator n=1 Tax=Desmospora activa DSM 45169 TaxID=1121389 RepID=A0A2T4YZM3_9BACL|nr:helix-turn-helix transcriptional regulator [Desmospora activa]PTM52693.1 DNA-binding XRE family transcriptional regulator [Desmospora activa DSM 45169]